MSISFWLLYNDDDNYDDDDRAFDYHDGFDSNLICNDDIDDDDEMRSRSQMNRQMNGQMNVQMHKTKMKQGWSNAPMNIEK